MCAFASNPNVVIIGKMNTQTNVALRFEEEISNAGDPPHGDQVPPLEKGENDDQAPVNPSPLTDENIRATLLQMSQALTTEQIANAQAQPMKAQANQELVPRPNQKVTTMSSHLTDLIQMNPPTFYGSNFEEDPRDFIYELYKILLAMRLSTSEKAELATYQLKDVTQAWYVQCRDSRPLRGGPVI